MRSKKTIGGSSAAARRRRCAFTCSASSSSETGTSDRNATKSRCYFAARPIRETSTTGFDTRVEGPFMLNLTSGEARWNPFAALGIPPESFSDSELDGGTDELGFSTLRDAYCRVALGATLEELREHGLDVLITNGAKEAFWVISAT